MITLSNIRDVISDKTDANRETWKRQSKSLHSTLRQTYVNYWSTTIAAKMHDSKALWSKINVLLKTQPSTSDVHTAEHFDDFFRNKVSKIRQSTMISDRPCITLSAFDEVSQKKLLKSWPKLQRSTVVLTQLQRGSWSSCCHSWPRHWRIYVMRHSVKEFFQIHWSKPSSDHG